MYIKMTLIYKNQCSAQSLLLVKKSKTVKKRIRKTCTSLIISCLLLKKGRI